MYVCKKDAHMLRVNFSLALHVFDKTLSYNLRQKSLVALFTHIKQTVTHKFNYTYSVP